MAVAEVATVPPTASSASPQVPYLVAPIDGAPVEGSALTFEWEPVPEATRYQLQVSKDAAFEDLLVNLPLQETTSLTVYSLLPEDGATYHWRVQAGTDQQWQDWSDAETLTAVRDVDVAAAERRPSGGRPTAARAATSTAAAEPVAEVAPFQMEATSFTQALLFFLLLLLGMALIAYLISLGFDTRFAATSSTAAGAVLLPLVVPGPRSR